MERVLLTNKNKRFSWSEVKKKGIYFYPTLYFRFFFFLQQKSSIFRIKKYRWVCRLWFRGECGFSHLAADPGFNFVYAPEIFVAEGGSHSSDPKMVGISRKVSEFVDPHFELKVKMAGADCVRNWNILWDWGNSVFPWPSGRWEVPWHLKVVGAVLLIDPVGYAAFVERVTAFIEHEHGFSRKPRAEVVPADVRVETDGA